MVCVRSAQHLPVKPGLVLGGCLCLAGVGMPALEDVSKVRKMGKKNQESISVFLHVEEGKAEATRLLTGRRKTALSHLTHQPF